MARSLTKSSASLVAAGGDLAEAAALTATANAIIQDADSVGTALKTTSLRLRGTSVKVLEEEGLDSDGAIESTSKLRSQVLATSGVDILTDSGAYKSTYQILLEIAEVWDQITDDKARAGLLELLAGKRNSSVIAALLQNPEQLKAAYEDAQNSAGSALAENEKYLDSIQGKIDQFNNAMQAMWSNTLDSDAVKTFVDIGTAIVKIVDDLGLIQTLFIGIGTYLMTKHDFTGAIGGFFDSKTLNKATERLNLEDQLKQAKEELNNLWAEGGSGDSDLGSEFDAASQKVDELNKKIKKNGMSIDDAKAKMKQFGDVTNETGRKGINAWDKLKTGAKKFGAQLKNVAKSMAIMYAITTALELVSDILGGLKDWADGWVETAEEAQEKFDELNAELSDVQSELRNLNSELEHTQDRIDELMSQGTLSFTEQEELNRLKAENAELERKITLNKTLEESLQKQVNSEAINATGKYLNTSFGSELSKTERQEKASETGGKWGKYGGAATGAAIGAFFGPIGALIGAGIGAFVGEPIGEAIGSAAEGAAYDAEQTVGDAMDNMLTQRATLKKNQDEALAKGDSEAYKNATEALQMYDKQMAQHITQIQANYNAMDWDTATEEERKQMIEYADWLDKYNISMGTVDAKSNAIARIFGDEASGQLKDIKKRMEEAAEAGKEISLADAFNGDEKAYNSFKTRLYGLGLTVYETEQYFKDQKEAADEAIGSIETYDAIKQIEKLTGGVNELKNAFKELHEEGIVSAETLLGMEDNFKHLEEPWKNFVEIMSSGTATMEEAQDAARDLAEAYIDDIISSPDGYNKAERLTYINHLQSIGVQNAGEFLDAKLKKDMATDIAQRVKNGTSESDAIAAVEEIYGITLDGENDRLLVEKAITAEKAKQEALDKQAAKNAYDTAVLNKGIAEEKNSYLQSQIDQLNAINNFGDLGSYGVTSKEELVSYGGGSAKVTTYYYNGQRYSNLDELKGAIASDLQSQKIEVPSLPAEVTEIDVSNANNASTEAVNDFQTELDKHGLSLAIDLIGFDEKVDKVQDVYSTLKSIATEYNSQGYLSLDNLQALLNLTPEYLAVLQMENGQITINQQALEGMLQTKLAEAEATAVQTAITQLNALAERKQAIEISNSAVAANQASIQLGTYSNALGTVAQDAIVAAGSVAAFNAALQGAQGNTFVSEDEINQVLANFNNSVEMINSVRDNLPKSFNNILDPGSKTSPEEVAESEWDKLVARYENQLALITNERDLIEAEIDQMEARGGKASAQYYEDLIRNSNEEKALLEAKKKALEDYLATNAGNIDQDTWTEYNNEINETAVAIKECETNTIELAEALREIDIHYFEQINDEISRLGEELDFVNSLLEDEEVADENGNWSSAALTRLGLYTQQMEMAAVEAQRYQDEIDKLNIQYANGELSEEQYQEKLSGLVSGQQDAIQSYEDAKDGIVELNEARIDAIKDGIEKEIEAYEDLIDLKKEELDAERDLFDFRKNVKKQTKDIATLERRIAALSGSTAASDIAERRKLQAELNEAREGLNDTYYERSKDQQSQALDDEAEAYRESKEKYIEELEATLEDVETLITNSIMDVMTNADTVLAQLNEISDTYGITLSEELTQPWVDAANKPKEYWSNAKDAISSYANFLTGDELGNKFGKTITGFGNQIQTIIDKWNGVRTAVEAAYEAQNRTPTVGGIDTSGNGNNSGNGGNGGNGGGGSAYNANVAALQAVLNTVFSAGLVVDGKMGNATTTALRTAQSKIGVSADGKYGPATKRAIESYIDDKIASWRNSAGSSSAVSQGIRAFSNAKAQLPLQLAKGTMGLNRDQFAITDESWIGEELTLAAGKNGQLQYLKKGSAVLPSELATNLVEWGKLNPDMLNIANPTKGINMINNAINKPEIKLDIAEFLHVDKVDKDAMPELEKFVDKKMNELVRQLNYSIKKFK